MKFTILPMAITMTLLLLLPLLAVSGEKMTKPSPATPEEIQKYSEAKAVIETRHGKIVLKFFPEAAPKHVKSFIYLAENGFYDGTIFHRVIPGFMIQGGDPTGTGTGGPGYNIDAEFSKLPHKRGALSMARSQSPDSAGSQFFIVVAASNFLDNQYSVFGEVVEGMEAVDKIVSEKRNRQDRPLEEVEMKISIEY